MADMSTLGYTSRVEIKSCGDALRSTCESIVSSPAVFDRWSIPFGVVCQPLAEYENLSVVDFGPTKPIRCLECRSYISCYNQVVSQNRQWRCLMCGRVNGFPDGYQPSEAHPELSEPVYEIEAPSEYTSRPPPPAAFCFVFDCSDHAVATGVLSSSCKAAAHSLKHLRRHPGARVSILTFDESVTFWQVTGGTPQEVVIPLVAGEPFIPTPNGLVIDLKDHYEKVERLLHALPDRYSQRSAPPGALGAALLASCKLIASTGGKVSAFAATLPTIGQGRLTDRARANKLDVESKGVFTPAGEFYRALAIEATQTHTSVDLYCMASAYMDVATLSALPRLTGGDLSYYPGFRDARDGVKLSADLEAKLSSELGLEAVFRARASNGLEISRYYGNFFIRQANLLSLCNVDTSSTIGIEMKLLTTQDRPEAFIQTALLYSTPGMKRRCRVATLPVMTTPKIGDMFATASLETTVALMAKKAAMALTDGGKIEDVRRTVHQSTVAGLAEFRSLENVAPGSMVLPEKLRLLPLLTLALLKTHPLRMTETTTWDHRAYVLSRLLRDNRDAIRFTLYPRCYAVSWGDEKPFAIQRLLYTNLSPTGVYVAEDLHAVYVWVGRDVAPEVRLSLLPSTQALTLRSDTPHAARVLETVRLVMLRRHTTLPYFVVHQGDPTERQFMDLMIDGAVHGQAYQGYLNGLHNEVTRHV
ncbi:COPII coat complex component Sec24, C (Sec24C) [Carpediemonas membranifera]|uniref:COPII coat complex component Sec24, C (Sec24C) n=1 Tax=Carpediemonas membranifera TaxID=201153 RepID=A0A8J6B7F9_9EUKA|nr:COPII coat complex component Sec24, C (Sec24C) [Carpediemonas membranifera]|eukprot:KAG9394694.1 COPII coat complex component Sec24, C (Sec24C) [Carpediemonas membranifera]